MSPFTNAETEEFEKRMSDKVIPWHCSACDARHTVTISEQAFLIAGVEHAAPLDHVSALL
jgi:hypothetical protein